MNNKRALIIFGKYPKAGNVKTRLAKNIGDEKAVLFYRLCTDLLFERIKRISKQVKVFFYYSPFDDEEFISKWVPRSFEVKGPKRDDLVEQNHDAFEQVFSEGYKQVIITTSDVPDLDEKVVLEAFNFLNKYDSVIGPDNDGGIYLYGMKKFHPDIFKIVYGKGVGFYDQLFENFNNLEFKTKLMEPLIDVDTIDDLRAWIKKSDDISDPRLVQIALLI
jgi:uncharacterized protein